MSSTLVHPVTGKPIEQIVVYGYRWFQRTYGNTYHTVIVFADGEELFRSTNMVYGYGRQFEQTAYKHIAATLGVRPNKTVPAHRFFADHGVDYVATAFDVRRKRDLLEFAPFAHPSSDR